MSELLSSLILLKISLYWIPTLTDMAAAFGSCLLDRSPEQTYWLFPKVVHCYVYQDVSCILYVQHPVICCHTSKEEKT